MSMLGSPEKVGLSQSMVDGSPETVCVDCGAAVPTIPGNGAYIFEKDPNKGDQTGVQRCSSCSDAYLGVANNFGKDPYGCYAE